MTAPQRTLNVVYYCHTVYTHYRTQKQEEETRPDYGQKVDSELKSG